MKDGYGCLKWQNSVHSKWDSNGPEPRTHFLATQKLSAAVLALADVLSSYPFSFIFTSTQAQGTQLIILIIPSPNVVS
jgi:hypothetical protein